MQKYDKVTIDGIHLTLDEFIAVTRHNIKLQIANDAKEKICDSRAVVDEFVEEGKVVYGVTTGFGNFSEVVINKEESKQLQKNLIISHAVGGGENFDTEIVRGIMLLRINNLSKGYSGIRFKTIQTMVEMLNKKVHPIVPEKGSLGASGDLVPLAHMVLPMLGLGKAEYCGEIMSGEEAMKKADISTVELTSKEGLALINGTQVMTSVGAHTVYDADKLLDIADLSASMTYEALLGITTALDPRIHEVRPHDGQMKSALNILNMLKGSEMTTVQGEVKVQDAYSIRCTPQVHGASRDAINFVKEKVEIEMNSVTDNPIIFSDTKEGISSGNFHGQPVALAFDFMGIALSELASISERRIERLVNPALSGLPGFLVKEGGLNSGFMIVQYSAAALVSENKILSHPASVDSIPSSANQEDHVSMGTIGARKAREILKNVRRVISMELMCATQAIDLRREQQSQLSVNTSNKSEDIYSSEDTQKVKKKALGKVTKGAYTMIRSVVPILTADREMYDDINSCETLITSEKLTTLIYDIDKEKEINIDKDTDNVIIKLDNTLPKMPEIDSQYRRAPKRELLLNEREIKLALKNSLRYIPKNLHDQVAPEFLEELMTKGRIYGYRFRPEGHIYGKPIEEYKGNCTEGKAIQVMIDNNLDFDISLYPYELVTYGETGQVCQNWMQYRLIKKYLEQLTDEQTLVISSGHPLGLFKSHKRSPRVIVTNGLMIGMFDNPTDWSKACAMGVSSYGQMTAGGFMYIGPQGIVHGTFNTLVNAGRLKLGIGDTEDLSGYLFVTSGLGGMSGAQPKAIEIAGGVGIVAEVDYSRIETRIKQGWITKVSTDLKEIFALAKEYKEAKKTIAIAYHGNIIDLLEYAVDKNIHIDLLSDQTSCHVPYDGGYCPQGIDFDERTRLLREDKEYFRKLVNKSLKHHFEMIKKLSEMGTYFFDYGNAFMKAVFDAGATDIAKNGNDTSEGFIFPSYVEDIMGPMLFDYGYGPFRWVCLSGKEEDLDKTDQAAMDVIDPNRRGQDRDNWIWIRDAKKNQLVVGTKARILYQDAIGRRDIALKFNEMVRNGVVGTIMLGRDHHDTGGTDSTFRETSNIKDGSNVTADMAIQCFAGNAARGMSLVALHNGGGVGIGKAINGGFGMVLDGSERVDEILLSSVPWDTMVGVARRNWARNEHAMETVEQYNREYGKDNHITIPFVASNKLIDKLTK